MTTPVTDFPHHAVQRSVRRMDVFFSAHDKQEYLDQLSQSASKQALDCPAEMDQRGQIFC